MKSWVRRGKKLINIRNACQIVNVCPVEVNMRWVFSLVNSIRVWVQIDKH